MKWGDDDDGRGDVMRCFSLMTLFVITPSLPPQLFIYTVQLLNQFNHKTFNYLSILFTRNFSINFLQKK